MSISSSLLKRFLILGILLLSAKAFTQETPFAEYIIGPADVLSVNVWQQEELSRTVTVRPDGFITYPLLGDLLVAGLTPLELRNQLAVSLGEYVNIMLSEVTVSVDEINSYTVSVMGEVNTPGRFSFKSPVTVLDVIAEAGGFTPFAASSRVVILRSESGVTRRIPFNYRRVTRGRTPPEQIMVLPGDIVMVP
ncbi:MAG: polysaccharide biosynthesis/export family protein [Pseudohongiella sp.]|nr:polysaccharide biosynthesis/export family protein [Pseudohongiella sp.]MDP2128936.1 polysaccharide biosynthesis/export family protein [Pseudohongiella sp.]